MCVFEGFRTVYTEADEEKEVSNVLVNGLSTESVLTKKEDETKQTFHTATGTHTEASLVRYWKSRELDDQVRMHRQFQRLLQDDMLQKRAETCI